MSSFTPGPWVLGKPERGIEDIHMCVVMTAYASGEHAKSHDVICECRQGSSVRIPLDQKIANARLIAAAPELLEALVLSEELYKLGIINASSELIDQVARTRRAAIAKATGQ